uniref:Sulfotransferase domain-containing protein n=1 Tax=Strongyloides stercoralis TaxID=6248 RepID=A0A0K0DY61_STRER
MKLLYYFVFIFLLILNCVFKNESKYMNANMKSFNNLCKSIQIQKNEDFCIPPYINYECKYRLVRKHNIIYCQIDKNLSSTMRMVLGALIFHNTTNSNNEISNKMWFNYYSYMKNLRKMNLEYVAKELLQKNEIETFLKNNHFLAIIRDPIERFISSFISKCVIEKPWKLHPGNCLECFDNVTCVINTLYENVKQMTLNHSNLKNHDYYTQHFVPQTWNCEFNKYQKYYKILFYEDSPEGLKIFYNSLLKIFKEIGVPNSYLKIIQKSITTTRSFNATHGKSIRKKIKNLIYNNSILIKKLIKIYFQDYVQFKIPFPNKFKI